MTALVSTTKVLVLLTLFFYAASIKDKNAIAPTTLGCFDQNLKIPCLRLTTMVILGDSMIGAGIHSADLLVIDRSVDPVEGKVRNSNTNC